MKFAILDFDGTITTKDSFADFIIFTHGAFQAYLGFLFLSPILTLYILRIIPNWKAKEKVCTYFFGGWEENRFNEFANRYARERIERIIRPKARERLRWHQVENHHIVIASASFVNYLKPWCEANGFGLLATQLEVSNGQLTGRIDGKNCYGKEKLRRVKTIPGLEQSDFIYAYGDTKGDLPLKTIADEFQYKPFQT